MSDRRPEDARQRATMWLLLVAIAVLIVILAGAWFWRFHLQIPTGLR